MTNYLPALSFFAAGICAAIAVMEFGTGVVGYGATMASVSLLNIIIGIVNLR
jgi:hypothetical protein